MKKLLLSALLAAAAAVLPAPAQQVRGELFESGNYAMFVHWGLYSALANHWNGRTYYGASEWLLNPHMAGADKDEYKATAKSFNPTGFDAREIAQLAKDAGMRYVVITSKHHDGFAMFHSEADTFNIVDATPFGRDPMKELSDACRELGLGFGFYYSQNYDWTTPGATGAAKVDHNGNHRTFDEYFEAKCLPQVEEITRNYGDIDLVWFDTPGGMPEKYASKLVDVVHRNQPKAFVSGRIGYGKGDYRTFGDMEVPFENVDGLWESVDVTNDSWGYAWYDNNWKTPAQIVRTLVSTVARGGTYMLNVGPDTIGRVPDFAAESLRSSGKWVKRYPMMVYGAERSPWGHALPWGDAVVNDGKLYLAIYDWPSDGLLHIPGLLTPIRQATLLTSSKPLKLKHESSGKWTTLSLPAQCPDSYAAVVELSFAPGITPEVDLTLALDPGKESTLSVHFAEAEGCHASKSSWMEKFGEWKHIHRIDDLGNGGAVRWKFDVMEPGVFEVALQVRGDGRHVWRLESSEGEMLQNQQGASSKFSSVPLGWMRFSTPGTHTVTLTMPDGASSPAEVASITFTPVDFR